MLKFLRKKTKAIVWTVIIAFISWGGYAVSLQLGESQRAAGRIFGKEVSYREYQFAGRAVQILSHSSQEAEAPAPDQIEAETWEFLVLSREARRRRVQVTDEEVRREIGLFLAHKGADPISSELYHQWIRGAFREEPREFENQIREHLRIQKLLTAVQGELEDRSSEGLKRWVRELKTQARVEAFSLN